MINCYSYDYYCKSLGTVPDFHFCVVKFQQSNGKKLKPRTKLCVCFWVIMLIIFSSKVLPNMSSLSSTFWYIDNRDTHQNRNYYLNQTVYRPSRRTTNLSEFRLCYSLLDVFSYNLAQIYPMHATHGIIPKITLLN